MIPLIKNGQTVLISKFSYIFKNPKIGDVVVLRNPEKKLKDKKYIIKKINKIYGGKYFVVGMNLKESTDSRSFGLVAKKEIIGKVLL
ncbi:MAG: S26 family signal peptidase [Patescibacteria group bacterium]|nr:S26 family signal peptidase [Patescibacteria group bacterium]